MPARGNRYRRAGRGGRSEVGLGRMLLASLCGHLLVALCAWLVLRGGAASPPPEPYRVELVALPVANPQAGRPDVAPAEKLLPPPPKSADKAAVASPKASAKKAAPLTGKGGKPAALAVDHDYDDAQSRIDRMRRRAEIDALKARLTSLAAQDQRRAEETPGVAGTEFGKGSDPGVTYGEYLRKYLKEAWTLSRYQVASLEREARAEISFDAKGRMSGYRLLKGSGETRFDDSVRRAILELKQLPTAPGKSFSITILFNLKELLE